MLYICLYIYIYMYRCTDICIYISLYIYICIIMYMLFAAFSSLFWDRCLEVSCLRVTLLVVDGMDRMEAEAMGAMANIF